MTTLTDRERELYERGKRLLERIDHNGGIGPYDGGPSFVVEPFRDALRAYDPPKRKYILPEWGTLTTDQRGAFGAIKGCYQANSQAWEQLRELTAQFEALSTEEQ